MSKTVFQAKQFSVTFFHKVFRVVAGDGELEERALQTIKFYTIDLTKIRGRGNLRCPKCRIEISPDDRTEVAYTILEPVMKGESLEKVILQCNSCGSQIHLTGFHLLHGLR